jgi:hypothetical protein
MRVFKKQRLDERDDMDRIQLVESLECRLMLSATPCDSDDELLDSTSPDISAMTVGLTKQTAEELPVETIIRVQNGENTIANKQKTQISFGSIPQKWAGPSQTFTIYNDGATPLTLGTITLPKGYTLDGPQTSIIDPGSSVSFTVTLKTKVVGKYNGKVSIMYNGGEAESSKFSFPIGGVVTAWVPNIVGYFKGKITIKKWFVSKSFDAEITVTEQTGTSFKGVAKIKQVGSDIPFSGTLNSKLTFELKFEQKKVKGKLNGNVAKNGNRIWGDAEIKAAISLDGDFEINRVSK